MVGWAVPGDKILRPIPLLVRKYLVAIDLPQLYSALHCIHYLCIALYLYILSLRNVNGRKPVTQKQQYEDLYILQMYVGDLKNYPTVRTTIRTLCGVRIC